MPTSAPNLLLEVKIDDRNTVKFAVHKMEGCESISEPFSFDLDLLSDNTDRALGDLLYKPAKFTMTRLFSSGYANGEGTMVRHGMLADIRLVGRQGRDTASYRRIYRARLVPQLWKMSLQQRSQVFANSSQTIKSITLAMLGDSLGSNGYDNQINVANAFVARDMVVQYQESDLHFVSRWLEHEGVHYTFDHSGTSEKVVLSDHNHFPQIQHHDTMSFADNLGDLATYHGITYDNRVTSLVCTQGLIPSKVVLQGYNWKQPASYIRSMADVDQTTGTAPHRGIGVHTEYNSRFGTQEDGNRLATIRAQTFYCREMTYQGTARSPFFSAGMIFQLTNHYSSDLNRFYLLTKVVHHAEQVAGGSEEDGMSWRYHNEFVAVPNDRVFRPERRTPWPAITGMINGKIHDPAGAEAAPVDSYGRYLVHLPFAADATGTLGQNTCRVRMAQPYAGTDFGMHFPLHDGTEVTLSFVDGDPDRPVITGALFDGTHQDPVTEGNATQGGIKTKSGSSIGFEDEGENSKISIAAGSGGSAITVGTLGKSHTGPLSMNQVQIYATKLDMMAGTISAHTSPLIINNSVLKWMSVTTPLNVLFMLAPLVAKSGADGKDPVLGTAVSPSEQDNIEAANMTVIMIMQTMAQLLLANSLAAMAGYGIEMSMVTKKPGLGMKIGIAVLEFLKAWPLMLVGGKGGDGVSLAATGVMNKIDCSAFGKNMSISAMGNIKISASEALALFSKKRITSIAPEYHFIIGNAVSVMARPTNKAGSIYMDEDYFAVHHGTEIILAAGIGPLAPVKSDLKLLLNQASLGSNKVIIDSIEEARMIAGPLVKTATISAKGTGAVDVEALTNVTVKGTIGVEVSGGAGQAKIVMGATGIKLSFGASSIEIGPLGITIKGPLVTVEGTKISIDGKTLTEVNGGLLSIKPKSIVGIG